MFVLPSLARCAELNNISSVNRMRMSLIFGIDLIYIFTRKRMPRMSHITAAFVPIWQRFPHIRSIHSDPLRLRRISDVHCTRIIEASAMLFKMVDSLQCESHIYNANLRFLYRSTVKLIPSDSRHTALPTRDVRSSNGTLMGLS